MPLVSEIPHGIVQCDCEPPPGPPLLVVLTGGPGAGKTTVLENARRSCCSRVAILPEAATLLFAGGFPRVKDEGGVRRVQRAIFDVQFHLEALAMESDRRFSVVLCDRALVDGAAYWPGTSQDYWVSMGKDAKDVMSRYQAVIHLRTPAEKFGYGYQNSCRTESPVEAQALDKKIEKVWDRHPRRDIVPGDESFANKNSTALGLINAHLPACCRMALP